MPRSPAVFVVSLQVAAQYGLILLYISCARVVGADAGKAALNRDAVLQLKRRIARLSLFGTKTDFPYSAQKRS